MISRLDDQLGSIVATLKSPRTGPDLTPLWDNTYTMMYTDHGEYLGDSDMVEKWPSGLHEVLVRDPLMIAGPGLPAGQVNEALCEMVDIVPTLFELLGVPESYPHSGKSLVETIRTNAKEHKPYAFSEGGFLLREEPQLELASFPYDRKAAAQHENTLVVGRAVSIRDKEFAYTYRLYEPAELFDRKKDRKFIRDILSGTRSDATQRGRDTT
jgi:arylsulfatase A-like enzyme